MAVQIDIDEDVRRFLALSDGSGYGYGYGDGYGDGDGSGYGYGDGSGDGYGDGSGDGSGYGYGYGSGYGYGYGYGSGYGSGYGDGDGIIAIEGKPLLVIDGLPTIIISVHSGYAQGYTLHKDLTLSPCYVARIGDCFAHGDTLHEAREDALAKYNDDLPIDVRIDRFINEFPSLESKSTGAVFYRWHNILTGSCRAGRDAFCKEHEVQLDAEYTVGYFLELVKGSYGSNVIDLVRSRYTK